MIRQSLPTKRDRAPKMSEAMITRAVIDHWRQRGVAGTRVDSIPSMGAMGQYGLAKGLPDLLVVSKHLPGGLGLLELKTETGKLSTEQTAFRSTCISAGAKIAVAYGLDQALEVLLDWGVIKPEASR